MKVGITGNQDSEMRVFWDRTEEEELESEVAKC